MQAQELGKSMPHSRHRPDTAGPNRPKPAVVGVWQAGDDEPGDDEPQDEPRIVGIGLAFDRLSDPQSRQLAAFEPQAGRWEELRWSLERVRARFGDGRLWRAEHVRPNASLAEQRSRLVDIGP